MQKLAIGIVLSTTRAARFGIRPATWIQTLANERSDMAAELIDLRDYPMPFFEDDKAPIYGDSDRTDVRKWTQKLDKLDGFIFVTAEYNRGPPAVLKNALDYAYAQFVRKPAAFVGYGGVGAARAIEQLRLWCIELQMAATRHGVHLAAGDFRKAMLEETPLKDFPNLEATAKSMLDDLSWWGHALKNARGKPPQG